MDMFKGWLDYLQRRLDNPETGHQALPLEEAPDLTAVLEEAEVAITAQPTDRQPPQSEDPEDVPDPKYWSPYCGTPV